MNDNLNNVFKPIYFFLLLLIFGGIFRLYNINFDDLWIDEISTFWISDPNLSLKESYIKNVLKTLIHKNYLIIRYKLLKQKLM